MMAGVMKQPPSSAFILPQALVLATSILVLATLLLEQQLHFSKLAQSRALHLRAESALRLNAAALVRHLELSVLDPSVASARLADDPLLEDALRPVLLSGAGHAPLPLYQLAVALSPENAPVQLSLDWSAEDLSLNSDFGPPPDFWPLPSWNMAPWSAPQPVDQFLDAASQGQWRAGPWIPANEPLPFLPDASPAFVPVVTRLALKFGVFASGPVRNREKPVRIRFYLEGEVWNPYNRPIQLHAGNNRRSVFRAIFFNLPEVRLRNLSNGATSSWILIDAAANSNSGQTGLHAWVKLPGLLQPGQHVAFLEPDPASQPEGLARNLHPGFLVGPADQVRVEFRAPAEGTFAALLSAYSDKPLEDALDGAGWFRLEGFKDAWPPLEFPRADSGPRPFYLPDGSLSFRIENSHLELEAIRNPDSLTSLDPRRLLILHDEAYQQADGSWLPAPAWIAYRARSLMHATPANPPVAAPAPDLALFSWPEDEPTTLLAASDLPQWHNSFLTGSPGASLLNTIFSSDWAWANPPPPGELAALQAPDGSLQTYREFLHINGLDPASWARSIALSATYEPAAGAFRFPAFASSQPAAGLDQVTLSEPDLTLAAELLVGEIRQNPFRSVPEFFNRGPLVRSLPVLGAPAVAPVLLPLRAWLRAAPPPRAHGAAWLLRLVVHASRDQLAVTKAARLWLLEVAQADGSPRFEIIRFEWGDPDSPDFITVK